MQSSSIVLINSLQYDCSHTTTLSTRLTQWQESDVLHPTFEVEASRKIEYPDQHKLAGMWSI